LNSSISFAIPTDVEQSAASPTPSESIKRAPIKFSFDFDWRLQFYWRGAFTSPISAAIVKGFPGGGFTVSVLKPPLVTRCTEDIFTKGTVMKRIWKKLLFGLFGSATVGSLLVGMPVAAGPPATNKRATPPVASKPVARTPTQPSHGAIGSAHRTTPSTRTPIAAPPISIRNGGGGVPRQTPVAIAAPSNGLHASSQVIRGVIANNPKAGSDRSIRPSAGKPSASGLAPSAGRMSVAAQPARGLASNATHVNPDRKFPGVGNQLSRPSSAATGVQRLPSHGALGILAPTQATLPRGISLQPASVAQAGSSLARKLPGTKVSIDAPIRPGAGGHHVFLPSSILREPPDIFQPSRDDTAGTYILNPPNPSLVEFIPRNSVSNSPRLRRVADGPGWNHSDEVVVLQNGTASPGTSAPGSSVPAITAVLPNVNVSPVFLGSYWQNQGKAEVDSVVQSTNKIVDSPFMDALHDAGYGVGRGKVESQRPLDDSIVADSIVYDSDIQKALASKFGSDNQDSNRLYVVFTPPNVIFRAIDMNGSKWSSSRDDTWATNFAYGWNDQFSKGNTVFHYVVIPYPGGTNGSANGATDKAGLMDALTEMLSHEIAEAAMGGLPIGDQTEQDHVRLSNGVAVQELGSPKDWKKAIPIPGATPLPNNP
jgi:hypothetical protein